MVVVVAVIVVAAVVTDVFVIVVVAVLHTQKMIGSQFGSKCNINTITGLFQLWSPLLTHITIIITIIIILAV